MLKRLALCLFLLSPAACATAPALAQAPTAEPLVKFIYQMDDAWPKPEYKMIFLSAAAVVQSGIVAWCDGFAPADEGEVEPSK